MSLSVLSITLSDCTGKGQTASVGPQGLLDTKDMTSLTADSSDWCMYVQLSDH